MKKHFIRYLSLLLCTILILQNINFGVFAASNADEQEQIYSPVASTPVTLEDSTFSLVNSNVQVGDVYGDENAYISEVPISTPEWYAQTNGETEVVVNSVARADQMVLLVQKWLNQEYGDVPGYGTVAEDGYTGWDTVYGLLRALQHELGITSLANSFGPTTSSLYSQNVLYRQDGVSDRKFAILQGALWCKGYNPGYYLYQQADGTVVFDEVFNESVEQAIIQLKEDAGFINPDGVVTLNVMKALMSMDSFKLLSSYGGDATVRSMQQKLNRKYEAYIGIIPCDGVYGRGTNQALIYALQAEEGLPTSVANGNFGVTTQLCCPTIPYAKNSSAARRYPGTSSGSYYTNSQISAVTEILQFALYVNGAKNIDIDGIWGSQTQQAIKDFQQRLAISITGKADKATWMSLLLSSGDTSRSALACDCATILTQAKAQTLYNNGYRYVGRYLTGTYNGGISKAITRAEAEIIFDAGLRFFPIYQTSANYSSYFTPEQGAADAKKAIDAAVALGLPEDTIIYFAVDFDALDYQVTSLIIPYFKEVHEVMSNSHYNTGIYGTRNTCSRVSALGYACSSFVGDMSTGFSGNLGYSMPDNWAFDQFKTVSLGSGEGYIEIDKDGFSGRDHGVSYLLEDIENIENPVDISFGEGGSTNVSGPVVNILGYQIPLFELDFAVGLSDVGQIQTIYDREKHTYQVIIGLANSKPDKSVKTEAYREIKQMINYFGKDTSTATWNSFQKLRSKLKKQHLQLGVDFEGYVTGYVQFSTKTWEIQESGVCIIADASGDLNYPLLPFLFLTGKLEGSLGLGAKFVPTGAGRFGMSGKANFSVGMKLGAKVGSPNINAYLGGKLGLNFEFAFPGDISKDLEATADISAFLEFNAFSFGTEFNWVFKKYKLLPHDSGTPQILSVTYDDFTLIQPVTKNANSRNLSNTDAIEENMPVYCKPQIINVGNGKMFMVFIDDAENRTAENRTILMYSYFDGNVWSEPQSVLDDGTGDFEPVICSDNNGGVHILWQNEKQVFDSSLTLDAIVEGSELSYIHWNGNTFDNYTAVTSNNEVCEFKHRITANGNNFAVLWQENSENDTMSINGTNKICRRQYINNTWQATENVITNLPFVSSIDATYVDDVHVVAYTVRMQDTDSEDTEVFYFDGSQINQITDNLVEDDSVCFLGEGLCWISQNTIVTTNLTMGSALNAITSLDSSVFEIKVVQTENNYAIVWKQEFESGDRLYGTMFNPSTGTFASPVPLAETNGLIKDWDVSARYDGGLEFVICDAVRLMSEEGKTYGQIDLIQKSADTFCDLSVQSIVTYDGEVAPGNTITIEATVFNNGNEDVNQFVVNILDNQGNTIETCTFNQNIAVGEYCEVDMPFALPSEIVLSTYNIQVLPIGNTDVHDTDNTAAFTLGYADLTIESICETHTESGREIRVNVTNKGFSPADTANIYLHEGGADGIVLSSKLLTQLTPGSTIECVFVIDESDLDASVSEEPRAYYLSLLCSEDDVICSNSNQIIHLFPDYSIELSASNGGTVSGAGVYENGAVITVTAVPNMGYLFAGWYENGILLDNIPQNYTFTVDSSRNLEARFSNNDLQITDIEISGDQTEGATLYFTAMSEGGAWPLTWEFCITQDTSTDPLTTSVNSVDFFEWEPLVEGTYVVTVKVTDSTGYNVTYRKEFVVSTLQE